MRIIFFAIAVWGTVLLASGVIVRVAPAEQAVILREGAPKRVLGPGFHLKAPLFEQAGIVGALYQRRVETQMTIPIENGESCTISAAVTYHIGDAARAVEWRLRHGLDISRKTSVFGGRNDYVEAERALRNALSFAVGNMSLGDIVRGGVQSWSKAFLNAQRDKILPDGARITSAKANNIHCTNGYVAKPPKPVRWIFGAPQSFAGASKLGIVGVQQPAIAIAPADIEVVLIDRQRVVLGGFGISFGVNSPERFYNALRNDDVARARLTPVFNRALADEIAQRTIDNISAVRTADLVDRLAVTLRQKLSPFGVSEIAITTDNAFYRTGTMAPSDGATNEDRPTVIPGGRLRAPSLQDYVEDERQNG